MARFKINLLNLIWFQRIASEREKHLFTYILHVNIKYNPNYIIQGVL
jgi:hypothetical protein